jgi:hypothetical protein
MTVAAPGYSELKRTLGIASPASPDPASCSTTTGTPVTYSATQ